MNDIENFITNFSFEEFIKDKKTINAVTRSLEIIGEASKMIPEKIKNEYSQLPWREMAGMRDKLIREYHGIDLEIVWVVIKEELPSIKPSFEKLVKKMGV
ncbi:MAG: HepT-like ribonuclease domain-containing protein [Candidatus Helarchaeota archaeon]